MNITFPMILFLIFMTLKLIDKVDWSWWWVASPIWSQFLVIAIIVIVKSYYIGKKLK